MQGNHKLTGSLNVTLSFPPSCLGRGLKMLLAMAPSSRGNRN